MYRCQICQCVVPPRTKARRVVLQVRKTVYPYRLRANRVVYRPKDGKKIVVLIDDPGGPGIEIAREALACRQCAENHSTVSR